jgi:hypothetical protein
VRRLLVVVVSLASMTACGDNSNRVNAGGEPTGDVAQPACVEKTYPSITPDDASRISAEQEPLRGDLATIQDYGHAHPDEYTSTGFDNDPTIRLFAYFSGHVDDHRAALAKLVAHADRLEVRQSSQSEREQHAIMDSLDHQSGLFTSDGPDSRGPVNISMRATAAARERAEQLRDRYRDRVCLTLAGHPFPRGAWPDTSTCPADPAPTERNAQVKFTLVLDTTTLARGEQGTGTAQITNHGAAAIMADTGSSLDAVITRAGSNDIVGGAVGGFSDLMGAQIRAEPGQTVEFPVRFGTDDCAPNTDYSLPAGDYTVSSYVKGFGRSDDVTITVVD